MRIGSSTLSVSTTSRFRRNDHDRRQRTIRTDHTMSRADAATGIRSDVFADADLSMPLKLFTLAALHLWETADERRKIKRFGNESWAYRALRMSGHTGTKEELTPRLERKSVVEGKSVAVRVETGGRRHIKK